MHGILLLLYKQVAERCTFSAGCSFSSHSSLIEFLFSMPVHVQSKRPSTQFINQLVLLRCGKFGRAGRSKVLGCMGSTPCIVSVSHNCRVNGAYKTVHIGDYLFCQSLNLSFAPLLALSLSLLLPSCVQ
jgi:uncharacterized protein YcsI (UPF0317 family)